MGDHASKGFWAVVKEAERLGCSVSIRSGHKTKVIIAPADRSIGPYIAHPGEKGIHPLRRYLKNMCKLEISA